MTFQGLVLSVVSIVLCRAEVDTVTQIKVVEVGGNVTLSCLLMGSHEILQVTWQKKNNNNHNDENLATYSLQRGVNVVDRYRGRLNFTRLSLNDTAITFWRVTIQDDGCYKCLFNTYPSGAIPQDSCLTVYELRGSLHYTISEGNLTATCLASAWPRPVISWIVPNAEGEETKEEIQHANGTISVISKLYVNSSTSLLGQELICRVQHMEKNKDYSVKVKRGQEFSVPWLVTAVGLVLLFIVVVLVVLYCRRQRKKQSACIMMARRIMEQPTVIFYHVQDIIKLQSEHSFVTRPLQISLLPVSPLFVLFYTQQTKTVTFGPGVAETWPSSCLCNMLMILQVLARSH